MSSPMRPNFRWLPSIALSLAIPLAAQSSATSVYAESFRQSSTRIIEEHFEVKLTPHDPIYQERIRDSYGADRFVFSITSLGPEGDTKITSWIVKLSDLHHSIYDNVLLASQSASDDPELDAKNALGRLQPGSFARVPIGARRIMKVDSFFVTLQVTAHHFTPPDSPYLDSMTVAVAFSNTDPRQTPVSGK
jgi:hypothetical protein